MAIITQEKINDLIENGYEFKIGKVISDGTNFYFSNFGNVFLSYIMAGLIPFLSILTVPNIFIAYKDIDLKNGNQFNSIFKFDKAGQYVIFLILLFICSAVIAVPIIIVISIYFENSAPLFLESLEKMKNQESYHVSVDYTVPTLFFILGFIAQLFILLSTIFVYPLIQFANYTALEAIPVSFKIAKHHIFELSILIILSSLLSVIGIFACYIGVLFSIPLYSCIIYSLYKKVFVYNLEPNQLNEIGENLNN